MQDMQLSFSATVMKRKDSPSYCSFILERVYFYSINVEDIQMFIRDGKSKNK